MMRHIHVRHFILTAALLPLLVVPSLAQFIQQGDKLVGTGGVDGQFQGSSVSLSTDGNTAIVGGPHDNNQVGAAWVYTRSGGVWTQQGSKLVGTGGVGFAVQHGISVSLAADGNTAIVGGNGDNGGRGAAWVYTRSGGVWTQQGGKLVGTGVVGFAQQGYSVSLSADGNTAIVGGNSDNSYMGAAWVFTRSGGVWMQQGSKLVGTGAVGNANQGLRVSISADGNTAILGGVGDNSFTGAAWVFTRSGGVWTQQGNKLVGTGGSGVSGQGMSVSLSADGSTAIVGGYADNQGTGAAWVYTRSGGVWTQQGSKLVGTGTFIAGSQQGYSVSLSADGNMAIVGGFFYNSGEGAVWVYTRSGGVWTQLGSKLEGTGAVGASYFGYSISLSADASTALVGGYYDNLDVGAAWVFHIGTDSAGFGITSITDVPSDQGGKLSLVWLAIHLDTNTVTLPYYSIWRSISQVPEDFVRANPMPAVNPDNNEPAYRTTVFEGEEYAWEWIANQPAHQFTQYSYIAPTLFDSMDGNDGMHYFLVSAHTNDPNVFYDSNIDSGYSVDNLAPMAPAGLIATIGPGTEVVLSWNTPSETDVKSYHVYRSTTSGFTPAPGNEIGTSMTTEFADDSPVAGVPAYYRVIAIDIHNNQSPPSGETVAALTITRSVSIQEKWNMISIPLKVSDYTYTILFTTAITSAFSYDGDYSIHTTLENGRGYWIKFSSGQSVPIEGLERTEDTIDVAEGWNMVGSLSHPISTSNFGSIPGGIVTSNFYGYGNGYNSSPTLEPGKGYWVKVSRAGQLVMSSTSVMPASNRISIADNGDLPPPPPDGVSVNVPDAYSLDQNYPNPFNPITSIRYSLLNSGHVTISIFNMLGEEVAILVNDEQEPGYKTVSFDASNLPSGVYTCRITAGTFSEVKKMLLVK
ncbi:MAG TPA: T9SS type A sorting domain-containing protein [Bacteroidota bacterium]|nr:T9SS type A sorting domain-containing protein [Bacteroidota bacterium]